MTMPPVYILVALYGLIMLGVACGIVQYYAVIRWPPDDIPTEQTHVLIPMGVIWVLSLFWPLVIAGLVGYGLTQSLIYGGRNMFRGLRYLWYAPLHIGRAIYRGPTYPSVRVIGKR